MNRLSDRFDDDTVFFTLTVYAEARGECLEGQVAVAYVIKHRLDKWDKYSSYKDVVLAPRQFSCWNSYKEPFGFVPPYDRNTEILKRAFENFDEQFDQHKVLRQCLHVVEGVMWYRLLDYSNGSDHYIAKWLYESRACPSWAKKYRVMAEIGGHIFLRSPLMDR